jgi:uncharacterized MAPEG superfamily protein
MTTELFWLTLTALFSSSLWIPYIIGVNITDYDGKTEYFSRPPEQSKMVPWVHRSHRAQLNLLEQFAPLAATVLIAHIVQVSTLITQWGVIVFFWLRVFHAIGMITGLARSPVRQIIFTASWLCTVAITWQVFAEAIWKS